MEPNPEFDKEASKESLTARNLKLLAELRNRGYLAMMVGEDAYIPFLLVSVPPIDETILKSISHFVSSSASLE